MKESSAGLFDFQVNGFGGVDFQDPELTLDALSKAVGGLRRHGTEGILLTLISDDVDQLERKLKRVEGFRAEDRGVREMIPGYHLEGPYLSPVAGYCGAHRPEVMKAPEIDEFRRLQEAAGGRIRLVTLAPEWAGSAEFIGFLREQGVKVALGHTCAEMKHIDDAIAAGAELATHVGNGVPALLPRHDNVVQRLLSRDELIACLIPDGLHLPPFVLKNYYRAKPAGKVFFTTDCMAAAGAPPGRYRLGHLEVEVGADRVVRMPGGTGFAGSSLTMDVAVRNLVDWLCLPEPEAVRQCSEDPRRFFGFA